MAGDQRIIHAGYRAEKMVLQMIRYIKGDLLSSHAEALVNPVNTVGVMGKGLALEFKKRYPANMEAYKLACRHNEVTTGKMFVTETGLLSGLGPRWIINFPTKQHYNTHARVEWIESGLLDLRLFLCENHVQSVAIPALGAGNGKLAWSIVSELIEKILYDIEGTEIFVYIPFKHTQRHSVIKRNP